jgi:hypothetical protein
VSLLIVGVACAGQIQLENPITTPLSAVLRWQPGSGTNSYHLRIRCAGDPQDIVDVSDLRSAEFRIALVPQRHYEWTVSVGPDSATGSFTTPAVELREITDPNVMFAGWFSGAHFVNMPALPTDPNAKLSPWFYKKTYTAAPTPKFDSIRDRLPRPIWPGHEDMIGMYWYAWKTLFNVWLYPPPDKQNLAVDNVIGFPTWAGWGSTMVLDTSFILQFARYGDGAYPFITALDNCYARQHENGFNCRVTTNDNIEVSSTYPANPPLLAWAEWSYFQNTGDVERLRHILLPLVKQYEWYMLYQRRVSGSYWTNGIQEADDSPRNPLMHESISTTTIQCYSAEILAKMATLCGRSDLAEWFNHDAAQLKQFINTHLWDSAHQIYNDRGVGGEFITDTKAGICKHIHTFWPLIAGVSDADRTESLVKHLTNPAEFYRSSGIASLSADSAGYNRDNGGYWRGSVWPCMQDMIIQGLERTGHQQLADQIADRYVAAFLTAYKSQHDITEFLCPDKPVMVGVGQFVGWGGTAPIGLFIENILGFHVDAPGNTITWRLRQNGKFGIENLRLGRHAVSLICEPNADGTRRTIHIDSDAAFHLVLEIEGKTIRREVEVGHCELPI